MTANRLKEPTQCVVMAGGSAQVSSCTPECHPIATEQKRLDHVAVRGSQLPDWLSRTPQSGKYWRPNRPSYLSSDQLALNPVKEGGAPFSHRPIVPLAGLVDSAPPCPQQETLQTSENHHHAFPPPSSSEPHLCAARVKIFPFPIPICVAVSLQNRLATIHHEGRGRSTRPLFPKFPTGDSSCCIVASLSIFAAATTPEIRPSYPVYLALPRP